MLEHNKVKNYLRSFQKVPFQEYPNAVNQESFVSVCVQTYQHVNFIRQCLDGILMQITDFPFEILLGDDESNDGTREVCIEYAQKYPEKIRLFLHKRENNVKVDGKSTGRFNFFNNVLNAKGKYLAICEGDDYWTSSDKLQKQVEFLENNLNYSLCCHDYKIFNMTDGSLIDNKEAKILEIISEENCEIDLNNWTEPYLLKTCAIVFRKDMLDYSIFVKSKRFSDIYLFTSLLDKGPGKFLNETMGVYRISNIGIWSLQSESNKIIRIARSGYELNNLFKRKNIHIYLFAKNNISKAINFLLTNKGSASIFVIWELILKHFAITCRKKSLLENYNPLKVLSLMKKLFQSIRPNLT